ncbi:DMT family transporter [Paenibacillus arenosi]|uniref:DMT family transporter n=1 Tax=Paenibacillus arenosi TaxID=2774142 RepID=A0ABR9B137_9BACL|nr:DMT family transporter [Paenibacillus arenosi]MBD8500039.1 DMT family transporter [Paenibacillus arenosi]
MKRDWIVYVTLLFVAFIWGASFIVVQVAVQTLPPLAFNAVRFIGSALLFLVVLLCSRVKLKDRLSPKLALHGMILGVCLFAAYALQTVGLLHTTTTNTGFITGISVVLVPFFSVILTQQKLALPTWIAAVLALVGLYLLTFNGQAFQWNYGDMLVLLCAVCFALHIAFTGIYASLHDTIALVTIQLTTVGVLSMISSLLLEPLQSPAELMEAVLDPQVLFALVVSIGLSTAFAFWAQTWCQKHISAARVALIFATEPVFAAITGIAFAGEKLGTLAVWGCIFIFFSMIVAEWKWNRHRDTIEKEASM